MYVFGLLCYDMVLFAMFSLDSSLHSENMWIYSFYLYLILLPRFGEKRRPVCVVNCLKGLIAKLVKKVCITKQKNFQLQQTSSIIR